MKTLLAILVLLSVSTFANAATTDVSVRACSSKDKLDQAVFSTDTKTGNLHLQKRNDQGEIQQLDVKLIMSSSFNFTKDDWAQENLVILQKLGIGAFKTGTRYIGKVDKPDAQSNVMFDVYNQDDGGSGIAISVGMYPLFIGSSTNCTE